MNILFIIKGNEPYVSQQAQIELAVGLQKKGLNMLLMGNFSEAVENRIGNLQIPYEKVFPKKAIDKEYIKKFKKIVELHQIDLVHFVDGKSARSGLLALKNTQVKTIIYFGSTSLHWYDPSSYLTYLNPGIDAIVCNSQFVYDHVKTQLFRKRKNKAVKIYKGYNPEWFENTKPKDISELGIPDDAFIVSLVGNHRKVKGTKYFLASSHYLASNKNIHYLLIGDKTDHQNFQQLKNKSPIADHIHLLGRRNDVVSILKSSDIYVQTSIQEGFGRAISEAMSVGKPIVMTSAGGCTELIDKNSGIITPLRDAKAIGEAISKLANDDVLREQMGENARKRIETVYHIEDTINNTLYLYQRIVHG